MSIYATILSFDSDDHADKCERWEPGAGDWHGIAVTTLREDGDFHTNPEKPCTCGMGEPWKYPNNKYPPTERAGLLFLQGIPAHIAQDPDEGYDKDGWCPYVGLFISERDMFEDEGSARVLLDVRQVTELRDALSGWLEHCNEDVL